MHWAIRFLCQIGFPVVNGCRRSLIKQKRRIKKSIAFDIEQFSLSNAIKVYSSSLNSFTTLLSILLLFFSLRWGFRRKFRFEYRALSHRSHDIFIIFVCTRIKLHKCRLPSNFLLHKIDPNKGNTNKRQQWMDAINERLLTVCRSVYRSSSNH